MLYSFTSYSLPDSPLKALLASARTYGYDGVELRVEEGHSHGVEVTLDGPQRQQVRAAVAESGLEVACVGCSASFADPSDVREQTLSAHRVIDLAGDIGARRIRVFGGEIPAGISRESAMDQAVSAITSLAPYAQDRGVTICVETHDDWSSPNVMAELMARVDHPSVGVLWDIMHPIRSGGSTSLRTWELLSRWVAHVHFHDGSKRMDVLDFKAMGTGEFDHREVLDLLHRGGYEGFLSGEWLDWEAGDVHLPREIARMRRLEEELAWA